jgi:hypothetical protein
MKRIIILLLLFLPVLFGYSQDSPWQELRVDENLSLLFPQDGFNIDTIGFQYGDKKDSKGFTGVGSFSGLGVSITQHKNVDGYSVHTLLEQISKEVCKEGTEMGWSCVVSDTTVNKIACKKAKFYIPNSKSNANFFRYIFFVNNKTYIFHITPLIGNFLGAIEESKKLLGGIRFTKAAKEQDGGSLSVQSSRTYNKLWIGYISGALFIIGVLVYILKRNKTKLNRITERTSE